MESKYMRGMFLVFLMLGVNQGQGWNCQQQTCYPGLFLKDEQIRELTSDDGPCFSNLYKLSSYTKKATFGESCGQTEKSEACGALTPTKCKATTYKKALIRKRSTCESCCLTVSSISVPQTVTDLFSGQQHSAKHFTHSYQLLNLGHCVTEGAGCGYQGTCMQATRIQWIMVTLPTGDTFVPTTVPSHCTCIYS